MKLAVWSEKKLLEATGEIHNDPGLEYGTRPPSNTHHAFGLLLDPGLLRLLQNIEEDRKNT